MRIVMAVIRREYLQRVRSKWFAFGTIAGPILMIAVFAVPIVMPRNTCLASAEMISPPRFSANSIPNAVFPEAVGPTRTMSLRLWLFPHTQHLRLE